MNIPSIIDLLFFLGISQGVFLGIALQLIQKRNRSANIILSIILILSAIMLVGRLYYYGYEHIEFFARLTMLVDSMILMFGPLLYLYIKRMIIGTNAKSKLRWFELIPSGLHLACVLWTFKFSVKELWVMYNNGFFVIPYFVLELSMVLLLSIHIIKCFILLKKFHLAEEKILSYHQEIYFYLFTLVVVFGILTFFWGVNFLVSYLINEYNPYFNYNIVWMCIPVMMYVVGFYSFKQPEVFKMPVFNKQKHATKDRLSKEKIEEFNSSLEILLVKDKIYLNPNLTLADLAKKLEVSTNDLSWLLNKIHMCSFYDYINRYRVQEFITKIQKGEHHQHTILALSYDSGFNSKSTFNKAFKLILNDTPSNYIKKTVTT